MPLPFITQALNSASSNLGMAFPDVILLLAVLCCVIMFALGMRIGLMFSTMFIGFLYIVFSLNAMPTDNILMVFFISLIVLALSFFVKPNSPGAV